jgi:geranylgeranyl pyrophosphate synthase
MEICTGELRAQARRGRYRGSVHDYLGYISAKTGALLEAVCGIGARLGGLTAGQQDAARVFGRRLGEAFQIVDDVLDYTGEQAEIGKPVGHDLLEGTATLPLLLAMRGDRKAELDSLLVDGGLPDAATVGRVVEVVRESGAIEEALRQARTAADHAVQALGGVPEGEARHRLQALASFVVERKL